MSRSDRCKVLLLMLLLWLPGLAVPWLAQGLSGRESIGVVLLSLFVIVAPLCVVARWRLYFFLWLPAVLLAPVYLYLCFYYRSVPGDVLISAALHTAPRDWLAMLGAFGWRWLFVPLFVGAYLGLLLTIDVRARWPWRKKTLAVLMSYAMVGMLSRLEFAAQRVQVPPLFDKQLAELVFPLNLALSTARVLEIDRERARTASIAGRATDNADLLVVLVIGETVRRDHLGIYGYARPTTPWMSAHRHEFIVFDDMVSTAQWTDAAVASLATRPAGQSSASLIQTFREAGFRTGWFSNQGSDAALSGAADVAVHSSSDFDFHYRKDESLLPPFEAFVRQAGPRQFAALHMMGSHFPYEERYAVDARVFRPTLTERGVAGHPDRSERAATVNSYDNTLVALDQFMARLITTLRAEQRPVLLIYTSDHGENLFDGDGNVFMHAHPQPTCHDLEVPLLTWTNERFAALRPRQLEALRANRARRLGHRDIFPTVLDLAGIDWQGRDPRDSFAASAFVEKPRTLVDIHRKKAETYDNLCRRGAGPAASSRSP